MLRIRFFALGALVKEYGHKKNRQGMHDVVEANVTGKGDVGVAR